MNEHDWEIEELKNDLKEEINYIFSTSYYSIHGAYREPKRIFYNERQRRIQEETDTWIESKIQNIPESDHKVLLTACLVFVYANTYEWFYIDSMPQDKDEMAALLLKTPFHILLQSYADTICDNCR